MRGLLGVVIVISACATVRAGPARDTRAPGLLAREILDELVAIDTSEKGDSLVAVQAVARRLVAAGYPADDVHAFESAPRRGNLVARLRGTGKRRPMMVMAHIDVVPAARATWSTDPFKVVEKDGYLYGRGTIDDKGMASALVAAMIRYKREGYRPDRDIILVLETDEELGDDQHHGLSWLLDHHRDLLDAEFALNEAGWVWTRDGKRMLVGVQHAEKIYQSFWIDVHAKGGHTTLPRADNAIYELSRALLRIEQLAFPIELTDYARAYFAAVRAFEDPALAADLAQLLAGHADPATIARVAAASPAYNALLRTTCVATMVNAGSDEAELAQLARGTVTCHIVPGHGAEEVQKSIEAGVAGTGAVVSKVRDEPSSEASPQNREVMAAIAKVAGKLWPGTPVVPVMSIGSSDAVFLRKAGIPTYGMTGLPNDVLDNRMHGTDERVGIEAFATGAQYHYELVKLLAGGR